VHGRRLPDTRESATRSPASACTGLPRNLTGSICVFGISMWEFVLIVAVALVFLGPRQFADAARAAGRMYRELQKLADDVRNTVDLDALTAPTPEEKLRPKQEPPPPALQDYSVVAPADRKSGPDFYADLLAGSQEDEEPKATAQGNGSPEPAADPGAVPQQETAAASGGIAAGSALPGAAADSVITAADHPVDKSKQ
jgi:Sec-independent protein translocase protein TatA